MNVIAFYRIRIVAAVLAASVLGLGYWWLARYQPRQSVLAQQTELLAAKHQRIRGARQQMIALGGPESEQRIIEFRDQSERLMRRVPLARDDAQAASGMTEGMSAAAARFHVRLHAVQPLERTREEHFHVDGLRVQAAGRYHDVGSFLTELLSFERITQLQHARLDVVPDTLLAAALRSESAQRGAQARLGALPVDPGLQQQAASLPEGEVPFDVSVLFTLRWFSQAEEPPAPGDTASSPAPSVPNLRAF